MQKTCEFCKTPFEAVQARRRWCSETCRKKYKRRNPGSGRPGSRGAAEPDSGPGLVERKVRSDIEALVTAHPAGEALAEMSYALARLLDNATGGMSAAAINRELRENLAELSRLAVDDGDELADELSAPELPA